jgi:hemolysin III
MPRSFEPMTDDDEQFARPKPKLRGISHLVAVAVALAGWGVLLNAAPSTRAAVAASVYGASLAVMFGVSALYHLPTWSPARRRFLRRLDHAAIFLLIAGTYTPLCLQLGPTRGLGLLAFVSTGAVFGIAQAVIYPDAPKYVGIPIYLALGWAVFPLVGTVRASVGADGLLLLAAGGIAYSAGAVIYWLRRPDPFPAVFGYHEIFHLLVVAAAGAHFAVILPVVRGLR